MVDFLSDACISGVLSIVVVDGCDCHLHLKFVII